MHSVEYLLVKHKVADFVKWRKVFDSHAEAQRDSGLHILNVMRDVDDPDLVVLLFTVEDRGKAMAFTKAPSAREAGEEASVIGVPEVSFLTKSG